MGFHIRFVGVLVLAEEIVRRRWGGSPTRPREGFDGE